MSALGGEFNRSLQHCSPELSGVTLEQYPIDTALVPPLGRRPPHIDRSSSAPRARDPDSVEFEEMVRAARKNAVGNSIDTICGFVRDKNSGPKPFLYVVQKDEAYIGGYTIATSAYRNICSITTLPDR
jgi:hypothetical protein